MKPSEKQIEKLERALAKAHVLQEPPRFSDDWTISLMREIRQQATDTFPSEISHLVWRAAAVVVLLSALFVGSVLSWNMGQADAKLTAILAEATVDPTLLEGSP
ncbi:MAG TPA: hypothetical protein VJ692_07975 [Nitrospiraceae bacterium]|nr:hypothetical protein [Nitrospiraceae bacterium]